MHEFKKSTLEEVLFVLESGSRPLGGVNTESGTIPSLGGENISQDGRMYYGVIKKVHNGFYRNMPRGHLLPYDVLINKDGAQTGKVAIYKGDFPYAAINEHLFLMRGKSNVIEQRFLFYYLLFEATQKQIIKMITGSAQPGINSGFTKHIMINVPSTELQRRIAEILDTIDEAIQKTEALISKLKAMKQGLLHDLLTRGLDKNGKLRDPKAHPEQFKDSPLGRIPKEWGVMHFESIVLSTTLGTTVRGTNVKEECVPLLKMGNLDWGEIVFEKLEYVQKGLIPSSENVTLQFRDLLFNTRNTPELVGKTAVWRDELPNAVHDNNLLRVRFKQGIASPFVCYYMSTGQGKDRVHALSTGTTSVAAIYWNNLRKYLLPIPPENEQERMVSIVDTHDARIHTEEQYRDKLKLQKKGLMHDLLTGKVRVNV